MNPLPRCCYRTISYLKTPGSERRASLLRPRTKRQLKLFEMETNIKTILLAVQQRLADQVPELAYIDKELGTTRL